MLRRVSYLCPLHRAGCLPHRGSASHPRGRRRLACKSRVAEAGRRLQWAGVISPPNRFPGGRTSDMSGLNKGLGTIQARLRWDPSPMGEPDHDLDLVAAVFRRDGELAHLVHFDSRSPDGTIMLDRDSRTGQGLGTDEAMTLELERMPSSSTRVVVGVVVQQTDGRKTFGQVPNAAVQIVEEYDTLADHTLGALEGDTVAVIAECVRRADSGVWEFHPALRGFDADPESFVRLAAHD
ncbi:TerD family protein [Streptomyces sp. TR06-5]